MSRWTIASYLRKNWRQREKKERLRCMVTAYGERELQHENDANLYERGASSCIEL